MMLYIAFDMLMVLSVFVLARELALVHPPLSSG